MKTAQLEMTEDEARFIIRAASSLPMRMIDPEFQTANGLITKIREAFKPAPETVAAEKKGRGR